MKRFVTFLEDGLDLVLNLLLVQEEEEKDQAATLYAGTLVRRIKNKICVDLMMMTILVFKVWLPCDLIKLLLAAAAAAAAAAAVCCCGWVLVMQCHHPKKNGKIN